MGKVYAMIGNRHMSENMGDEPAEGMLRLIVNQEVLDNTYRGFLGECRENLGSDVPPEERPVLSALEDVLDRPDANMHPSILVFDRAGEKGNVYGLDDNVSDTGGGFLYSTKHTVDGQRVEMKTLEMYLLEYEHGG